MTNHKQLRVIFCGLSVSRVSWYRCVLPALLLGADHMGYAGTPPEMAVVTASVGGQGRMPNLEDYDVLVIQQPRGAGWVKLIESLRAAGKIVLLEYDDYVHGIRNVKDHDFREGFQPEHLRSMEACMRVSDGMICSTGFIARKYSSFTPKTYVCENGLDLGRYRLTLPQRGQINGRETVTIMWSGATGHRADVAPWLNAVRRVMRRNDHVCFVSIGQSFADELAEFDNRVMSIPFSALETYPAAMTHGDIALAPAGKGTWHRAKSGIRAMEAAVLGMPIIADTHYAPEVIDGVTGFVVNDPGEAMLRLEQLVGDPDAIRAMGAAAREHGTGAFTIERRINAWREAILDAWDPTGVYLRAA